MFQSKLWGKSSNGYFAREVARNFSALFTHDWHTTSILCLRLMESQKNSILNKLHCKNTHMIKGILEAVWKHEQVHNWGLHGMAPDKNLLIKKGGNSGWWKPWNGPVIYKKLIGDEIYSKVSILTLVMYKAHFLPINFLIITWLCHRVRLKMPGNRIDSKNGRFLNRLIITRWITVRTRNW